MGLIGLYLSKVVERSVRTRSFFDPSYRFVQQRTVAYRGLGGQAVRGGKGRERREDCEKAVFSFYSGKEERKKEKH